ncbi:hypothetical protein [Hyalangium gracile]|uniref:hypothetical protein n=1 Tax=Hyalangium gracile TaxID=394092 RepID=UPI001CCA4362|nr:hypothetical protein [Hyalangium gracile]
MRLHLSSEGLVASVLGVLLASCSPTRYIAPPDVAELSGFVLLIREMPDGRVDHTWQRAEDVELSQATPAMGCLSPSTGTIVLAMSHQRDCDEELRECMRECMSRPLPRGFGHMTSGGRGKGGKEEYCNRRCMQPYLDCLELQELRPREFTAIDAAVDWLKRHRKSLLVGSVVVIAGVAFVVVSAGAGLVVLAPAVILASSGVALPPCTIVVSQ